jgi:hypothetical protein
MTKRNALATAGLAAAIFGAGLFAGRATTVAAQQKRVFEVRTYTTEQLDTLVKRMREGESQAFERAGMKGVLYSVAAEAPRSSNTFVYILAHDSLESAARSWTKFREDPEWLKLRAALPATVKVESIFVSPLDFSPLK